MFVSMKVILSQKTKTEFLLTRFVCVKSKAFLFNLYKLIKIYILISILTIKI